MKRPEAKFALHMVKVGVNGRTETLSRALAVTLPTRRTSSYCGLRWQVVGLWRFTLHEMVVFETIDAIDRRIQVRWLMTRGPSRA